MSALADSSAWVELLRGTGSAHAQALKRLLAAGETLSTDVVVMEVLTGARSEAEARTLGALLATATPAPVVPSDWRDAARLHRRCRSGGETVRRLNDCLIGAVAIRIDVPVLHRDADFEVLARHTPLRILDA